MINQLIPEIKSTKKEIRNFGITFGLILLVIGAILLWKDNTPYFVFIIIGLVLLGISLVIPIILKPAYFSWMIFANILGWVMTRLILSLLFYAMVTPIGFIARLFGKQFIELKWDKSKNSYWNYRSSKTEKASYEKQY